MLITMGGSGIIPKGPVVTLECPLPCCSFSVTVACMLQNKRVNINKDELKSTSKAIETVHNLCCNENKGATELVAELGTLYQCIRWAAGALVMGEWGVSLPG